MKFIFQLIKKILSINFQNESDENIKLMRKLGYLSANHVSRFKTNKKRKRRAKIVRSIGLTR